MVNKEVEILGQAAIGDGDDTFPEVAVVGKVTSGTPLHQALMMLPLRVREEAKDQRHDKGDPQSVDKPLDEGSDGVGSSDEVSPVPLFPNAHILAHDGLLRSCST